MASAVSAVLGTYEVLEKILLKLPTRSLFVVQRVSRSWKSLVRQSHPLQKRMFLKADGQPCKPLGTDPDGQLSPLYRGCLTFNPILSFMLEDKSPHHGLVRGCANAGWWRLDIQKRSVLNGRGHLEMMLEAPLSCGQAPSDDDGLDELCRRYTSQNASCNDMFLTQPPIVAIGVVADEVADECLCMIYNPTSLTFRDVQIAWNGMDRILADCAEYESDDEEVLALHGIDLRINMRLTPGRRGAKDGLRAVHFFQVCVQARM